MDYDFSSLNEMLSKFSDKIKTLPTSNLSPELLDALDNLSHSPQISSIQETARKLQIYYSNLYNPALTATAISQAASKALSINIPYGYDSISGVISAMSSYSQTLASLNTTSSGIDSIVSVVSSALSSLDKTATSSEEKSNDYIELSEPLVDIVQQVDNSIELPVADNQHTVKIEKSNPDLLGKVLPIILAILAILQAAYYHTIDSVSSAQDYAEIVQILEQIEENTSADYDSQEPAHTTTQSE